MSISNIQYRRAKPFNNDIPGIFRIRLESEGSTARVEFFDDRSREIFGAIAREVSCFRREHTTTADRHCNMSLSDPFSEWFGLVLGDVYSDRHETIEFLSGSDLKYAFALRIMCASSAVPLSAEASRNNGSDFAFVSETTNPSIRDPLDLGLLPPPLWRLVSSTAQDYRHDSFSERLSSIDRLCFFWRLPSGQWSGRVLNEKESQEFRPMVSVFCSCI